MHTRLFPITYLCGMGKEFYTCVCLPFPMTVLVADEEIPSFIHIHSLAVLFNAPKPQLPINNQTFLLFPTTASCALVQSTDSKTSHALAADPPSPGTTRSPHLLFTHIPMLLTKYPYQTFSLHPQTARTSPYVSLSISNARGSEQMPNPISSTTLETKLFVQVVL